MAYKGHSGTHKGGTARTRSVTTLQRMQRFRVATWSIERDYRATHELRALSPQPSCKPYRGEVIKAGASDSFYYQSFIMTAAGRVAIIGAGPCGMFLLRAFAEAEKKGVDIPEIVCYEKQDDWGGMWRYTWRTGVDQHGEPVHASMYRHLWSNVPKEYCELPDYSFDQHYGRAVPSYLTREETLDYLIGRMNESNVRRSVRFNTAVRHVQFDPNEDCFTVRVEDLTALQTTEERFDHVVVASGHFSCPQMPSIDGIEEFPGRILHSHDFRDAREFTGQNVLVIGASYSGEDIGLNLMKFGAKSVTISHQTRPLGYKWPKGIEELPLVLHVEGKTAHFKDGSQREVDSIIMCTGYRHHFPFLADDLRLVTSNRVFPDNLFKTTFLLNQNRLAFMGMNSFFFSFCGLDIQAWFTRDVILGRITLPEQSEQASDVAKWQDRESSSNEFENMVPIYVELLKEWLNAVVDYPPIDLESAADALIENVHNKMNDVVEYRNKSFKSHVTGTKAIVNPTSWFDVK